MPDICMAHTKTIHGHEMTKASARWKPLPWPRQSDVYRFDAWLVLVRANKELLGNHSRTPTSTHTLLTLGACIVGQNCHLESCMMITLVCAQSKGRYVKESRTYNLVEYPNLPGH